MPYHLAREAPNTLTSTFNPKVGGSIPPRPTREDPGHTGFRLGPRKLWWALEYGWSTAFLSDREGGQWLDHDEKEPEAVTDFSLDAVDLRRAAQQRNAVYRSVICLTIVNGARDFHTGNRLTADSVEDPARRIEDHHLFPTGWLKMLNPPMSGENSILNRALIDYQTKPANLRQGPVCLHRRDRSGAQGREAPGGTRKPSDPLRRTRRAGRRQSRELPLGTRAALARRNRERHRRRCPRGGRKRDLPRSEPSIHECPRIATRHP